MRALAILLTLLISVPAAQGAKLRRPFSASIGVNYGFDHNGSASGCVDYGCGGVCYNTHTGTDFPLSLGTGVLASAAGRVTATYNGCANYGYYGNTCGGSCGNYVKVDHLDGTVSLFCHMQLDSIAVGVGQNVSCGQYLGNSASSGSSTGPHLHLGFRVNGTSIDPFAGGCSQSTSWWVGQGSYPHPIPSATCETTCECSPGQVENQGCGNCGSRSRTCGSNCYWGGWSGCSGEGPCSPGQTQTQACCDCGSQSRTCTGSCQWPDWGNCWGPDPDGGQAVCETGEPGPCAEGRRRCADGCLACVRIYEPRPERCDLIDDDCTGVADDGYPQEMGDPPPPWSARLIDTGVPQATSPGERFTGWVAFENTGTETWTAGSLWLEIPRDHLEGSMDWLDDSWYAFSIPSLLLTDVPPGSRGLFEFTFHTPDNPAGSLDTRLQLVSGTAGWLRCPSPNVDFSVLVLPASQPLPEGPRTSTVADDGCACRTGRTGGTTFLWPPILLPLAWIGWRRRRLRS
ncbi:M23 family metallopeptidase [Myxococcota bacterium]|nr:M23 family metallopeptidase [Myxococcota bacterium]MBU1410285.1 M23 family metallopeptidase [Myxococcota bacterium]MBU1510907.1 M23 family metallopeptidase [Myxococcota bacterium]